MSMPEGVTVTEAATQSITTGATAQQVFARTNRKLLIFVNSSDTAMYLRFNDDADATAALGIPVAANGGTLILNGGAIPSNRITVLCATTGKTFYAAQG